MNLFNVYPLFDIEPIKGEDCYVWDSDGKKYLDLYGGHAVISIGHSHPHYVKTISDQLQKLGFYSNSVINTKQAELATKLGELSGFDVFSLFLINSGAEAMENALKVAAFHNQRKKIIVFERAFHGRTSAAVAITHNPKIQSSLNPAGHAVHIPFNDVEALEKQMANGDVCAIVVESIQGVGGIHVVSDEFWAKARELCNQHGTILIADEIQSGYGRSGKFFAFQHSEVQPDLITMAKGMGNGFPIGGVLIHPKFEAWYGMLGTTFGGNHLACAAGIAVLDVLAEENLMANAAEVGEYLKEKLIDIPGVSEVRGHGLMLGMELPSPAKPIRAQLLHEHGIFTGSSSQPNTLRLLPPLTMTQGHADQFLEAMKKVMVHSLA